MEIVKVEEVGVDAAAARAADVIAKGGIVAYPTDTLYGLGVNALDEAAVKRLKELKGRDEGKPISIMVPNVDAISWHAELTPAARVLAEKFLPGPLTLVVPAKEHLPQELTSSGTIGIRIPDDAFSRAFSAMSEHPITSTSANLAGMETPHTVKDLLAHFGPKMMLIDLYVDDGPRSGGVGSTVVSCLTNLPVVLREGAISKKDLGL